MGKPAVNMDSLTDKLTFPCLLVAEIIMLINLIWCKFYFSFFIIWIHHFICDFMSQDVDFFSFMKDSKLAKDRKSVSYHYFTYLLNLTRFVMLNKCFLYNLRQSTISFKTLISFDLEKFKMLIVKICSVTEPLNKKT